MRKNKKLTDAYKFRGYAPTKNITGVFGDSRAIVIQLKRIEKKRYARTA